MGNYMSCMYATKKLLKPVPVLKILGNVWNEVWFVRMLDWFLISIILWLPWNIIWQSLLQSVQCQASLISRIAVNMIIIPFSPVNYWLHLLITLLSDFPQQTNTGHKTKHCIVMSIGGGGGAGAGVCRCVMCLYEGRGRWPRPTQQPSEIHPTRQYCLSSQYSSPHHALTSPISVKKV